MVPKLGQVAKAKGLKKMTPTLLIRMLETRFNALGLDKTKIFKRAKWLEQCLKSMSVIQNEEALKHWNNKCILFKIDDIEYHYLVRHGVFVRMQKSSCEKVDHGIVTSEKHFKVMLVSPLDAVTNFVQGHYEIIGPTTKFLAFLRLFK